MKMKKICSLFLAMVLVVTLFAVSALSISASAETAEKQMLVLGGTLGKVGMMVPAASIQTNVNYTVRFKYNGDLYETVDKATEAGAADNAVFSVFYKQAESGGGRMQYHIGAYGTAYSYCHITDSTAEYTFKITASTLDNYYVGFFNTGKPSLNIADMVMFRTDDDSQTNILPEAAATSWSYLGYGNGAHNMGRLNGESYYTAYNAEYFPDSGEMLHLNGAFVKVGMVVPKSSVSVGENYTVRFKYRGDLYETLDKAAEAGATNSAVFSVFSKQAQDGGARMQYHVGSHGSNKYTYCKLTENTAEYQFKISAEADYYYVGFFTSGNPDLYIADMVMYKTSDATMTNILPEKSVYSWRYLVGNYSSMRNLTDYYANVSVSNYEARNVEYFALDKQMIHFDYENVSLNRSGIKVNKDKLLKGNYTVEFKYKMKEGNFVYSLNDLSNAAMFGVFYHQTESGVASMQYLSVPGASGTYEYVMLDSNTISYTFTIADWRITECIDDFYVGFFANGSVEFYVTDMVMYKTTDTTKTNILSTEYWTTDWQQGSNPYSVGLPGNSAFEDYDASIFSVLGDGNNDGKVNIRDLVAMKLIIADKGYQANIDFNNDNALNSDDLVVLRKHLLGVETI